MTKRLMTLLALVVSAGLIVAGCGGDDDEDTTTAAAATTTAGATGATAAGGSTDAAIEQCLTDAGEDVVTGNTPVLEGAEAVGIDGGGSLEPGGLTVAIFVYDSEQQAQKAAGSPIVDIVADSAQEGNVFVAYADPPDSSLKQTVEDCAFAS